MRKITKHEVIEFVHLSNNYFDDDNVLKFIYSRGNNKHFKTRNLRFFMRQSCQLCLCFKFIITLLN